MQFLHKSFRSIAWPFACCIASIALLNFCQASQLLSQDTTLSYNRDVRPILSKHCFACHGPDEETREAGARLDVPDEIDVEEVLARIEQTDDDAVMPPPEFNKPLSAESIDVLKRWIKDGAKYEQHWSFVPPKKRHVDNSIHPVDYFINRKLKSAGLEPTGKANAYTRIRRVYLDLTGLPPTIEAADQFAQDPSDQAYGKIVDELLASPRYGERWAQRWLDLARYADTNGYEKDRDRTMWPYRDWVIRSINEGKPFDQFTVEQLAGDMLPNRTPSQIVATGFHRNTMLNEEGGIDPLEFRYHAMADRNATTGTVWLGMTVECCQCHTHKFDPITHENYFGLMAYLDNTDEPDFELPPPNVDEEHKRNLAQAKLLLAELPTHWPTHEPILDKKNNPVKNEDGTEKTRPAPLLETELKKWLADQRANVTQWKVLRPKTLDANTPYLTAEPDGSIFAAGDISKHDIYTLTFPASNQPITHVRLEALPDPRLPGNGPGMTYYEGRKGSFFVSEFVLTDDAGEQIKIENVSTTNQTFSSLSAPSKSRLTIDGDIQTGWAGGGANARRHVAVFKLAKPLPAETKLSLRMDFSRHFACPLGKFRVSVSNSQSAPKASNLSDELLERLSLPDADSDAQIREAFLLQAKPLEPHAKKIRQLQKRPAGPRTWVMRERPAGRQRPTYLRHRGEFTQPKNVVKPHLPEAIKPNQNAPTNRLEFAKWLVSRENPLTARVVANRQWAAFFGTGLVKSVGDFGSQGELPSHPELLDYLAVELMDSQWSIKALHRLIVTSDAYQRQSIVSDNSSAQSKRLLQRFPRTRLEAETIRDASLLASGLLSKKMFGKPVRPPQPKAARGANYAQSTWQASSGEDRFRRSVYTYRKRTAPFAMFTTFDGTSGESCIARRDVSNTPLQALTLLNDPMFVEIAQAMGKRMAEVDGDAQTKIATGFRWLMTRPATPEELQLLTAFHQKHDNWTAVARVLLCLDETIVKN